MKTVSVIIPTYKPDTYIYECLHSLEQQTLSKEYFEVVIVLNGEKEPYFSKLKQFINSKTNYQLLYSEQSGVSNARNLALDKINNEYVTFLDDDDYLSDNYLANMLAMAKPNEMVVSNVLCFNDDENRETSEDYISKHFKKLYPQRNEVKVTKNLFQMRKFFSSVWGGIFYKEDIIRVRFDITCTKSEDALFMSIVSSNIKNIAFAKEETIYYYRLRQNSASRTKQPRTKIIKNRTKMFKKFTKVLFEQKKNYLFHMSRIFAQIIIGVKELMK